ncbi:MAG: RNA methyltransferase [Acidimicrobiia bacterium]
MTPVTPITSFSNPLVKQFKRLHRSRGRGESGRTLIEGPKVFGLAVDVGIVPEAVLRVESDATTASVCTDRSWEPVVVSAEVLVAAADSKQPRSPVAMIKIPHPLAMRSRDTLIITDVSDPGNVGTMIRSAAAFGWDVCVTGTTADPWSPKVIRAGAGAHFGLHLSTSRDPVAEARKVGLEVVAAVVSGGDAPERRQAPIALLIGSEAHGLTRELIAETDRRLTLPMPGNAESLNAAVAASIAMYVLTDARCQMPDEHCR